MKHFPPQCLLLLSTAICVFPVQAQDNLAVTDAAKIATTLTLSATPAPAYVGALTLLTARVSKTAATGTVTFYQGAKALGSAALNSGSATLSTGFTKTTTYTLKAVYAGNSTYAASASSSVSLTVKTPSYPLTLSSHSKTCGQSMSISTQSSASASSTSHTITYCSYSGVVYAANPDNSSYESMNIYIPTAVDGTSVTTSKTGTPVLLENCIGGYMGCSVSGSGGGPAPIGPGGGASVNTNGEYFLANGYVVVEVGARGRDVADSSGKYGSAPAGLVDLKAAVRFLRANASTFPGDVDLIFSSGGSAGGAMSTMLGASGNSTLFNTYLAAIGAANARDNIYGVIAYSPITNLDHADMAYEWEYHALPFGSSCATVNSTVSGELRSLFESYQSDLALSGSYHDSAHNSTTYPYGSGTTRGSLGYANIENYILDVYLIPSAEYYLASLSSSARASYLASNSWITYSSSGSRPTASFTFANYLAKAVKNRGKSVPAFDSFYGDSTSDSCVNTSETAEVNEFGDGSSSTSYRHFTNFSSEFTGGSAVPASLQTIVNMMNPMYFITTNNMRLAAGKAAISDVPRYWFIRDGSIATDTSAVVIVDLATALETLFGEHSSSTAWSVNAWENWGQGHNVNADPWDMIAWVKSVK